MVANEWKDANDKVMPVKQWLEERRFLQVTTHVFSSCDSVSTCALRTVQLFGTVIRQIIVRTVIFCHRVRCSNSGTSLP